MKYSFEMTTKATPEEIWHNYSDVQKWFIWEADLLDIKLDGPFQTGVFGEMTLEGMPPLAFELVEVLDHRSFCDVTKIPGIGSLYFNHELIPTVQGTVIKHSVELVCIADNEEEKQLSFLTQVYSDVPQAIFSLAKASVKS